VAFYGVYIPPSVDVVVAHEDPRVFSDKASLMTLLKKYKSANPRFKVFSTEGEAEAFASQEQIEPVSRDVPDSPRPSEGSIYKSLTPQEEVKLRKAIEANPSDLNFMRECLATNPRYLVTATDTPNILHQGSRHNALHVAAKLGREEAARLVLHWVVGGDLVGRLYPDEVGNLEERVARLSDLYLNMPNKGAGDTPLHLAAKFGRVGMVRLLASMPLTQLAARNAAGETPEDVVCSRCQVPDEEKQEILAALRGEVAIPVYATEEGVKRLGEPLCWQDATELLDTTDSNPICSSPGSPMHSPMPHSPLRQSPLMYSPIHRSPLSSNSSLPSPLSCPSISALMGPMASERAEKVLVQWKGNKKEKVERLEDPGFGAERQGRRLAASEGVPWREWWPWLGGWADLRSPEGLEHLEEHLERRHGEQQLRERMDEVEEQDNDNKVNSDEVFHGEDHFAEVELALSPLSSLSKNLGSLSLQNNLDNLDSSHANTNRSTILSSESEETEHHQQEADNSLGIQVVQAVNRFAARVAPLLADRLPEVVGEQQAADWGQELLHHWVGLRRKVNNWRSDPAGRYAGLDFSRLAGKVAECLVQELELELGLVEMQRSVQLLNMLANPPTNGIERVLEQEFKEGSFNDHRSNRVDRQESSIDWSKLKEVQGLARIAAQVYSSKTLPDAKTLLGLWEVQGVSEALATKRVNQARRFLHSSTSSTESESNRENFMAVNLTLTGFAATTREDDLANNEEEGFLTPPSSVMSQGSSMETCDEGDGVLYLHGSRPTQEDRRVVEATSSLQLDQLDNFPRVAWYLASLRAVPGRERRVWPEAKEAEGHEQWRPRKLDMDTSFG